MATATGMPLFDLAALCVGVIPAHSTLGISIPTSGPPEGQRWICSTFGCTSIKREGQFWDRGRGLRSLGAWFLIQFIVFTDFNSFTVISPL